MTRVVLSIWLLAAAPVLAQGPLDSARGGPAALAAPPPAGFDRAAAQRDTLDHLKKLIALDTQNPPGREGLVARYLQSALQGIPGIEMHVLEAGRSDDPANARANFVARLRAASPTKRPVLIMGHMDVVGADASKWITPPFTPTERDGYLYGRGAIDDKGPLAAALTAMRLLAAKRDALDRDIILLGTAAEEGGNEGIEQVVAQHFDLIKDAEFALNEGGRVRLRDGRVYAIGVQVTEKLSYVVRATARGPSGHGSVPLADDAIAALARAVARVHEARMPVRLNPITREYFAKLATIEADPAMKDAMTTLAAAQDQARIDAAAALVSRDPAHNATLRTGISLTMINGGIRANVIPSDATATFNVRTLPDGDIAADVAEMNRIGAERQVTFELQGRPATAPPISSPGTALFRAMEAAARAMAPDAVVMPFMSTGATDGALLRENGIPTYGILPMPLTSDDELRMHGDNERVPLASIGWATEYLYRVLVDVAAR